MLLDDFAQMHGWKQAELARAAGLDPAQVARYMAGRPMRRQTLERICEGMELTAEAREELMASYGFLPQDIDAEIRRRPRLMLPAVRRLANAGDEALAKFGAGTKP